MKHVRKWLMYAVYFLAAVVFFLFFLFPSDAVVDYVALYARKADPLLDVRIERIQPVFPPGIALKEIDVAYDRLAWVAMDGLKLTPDYGSLFSNAKAVRFNGTAYGGKIKGRAIIRRRRGGYALGTEAALSGIRLEKIQRLSALAGRRISGALGAVVQFDPNAQRMAQGSVTLDNVTVEMPQPFLNIRQIEVSRVEADLVVEQDRMIIKRCIFKGPQADGNLSGSLAIAAPFNKSRLDIRGTVKPHHSVLAGLQKIGLFSKQLSSENGFPIRLMGTVEKPRYSFR